MCERVQRKESVRTQQKKTNSMQEQQYSMDTVRTEAVLATALAAAGTSPKNSFLCFCLYSVFFFFFFLSDLFRNQVPNRNNI